MLNHLTRQSLQASNKQQGECITLGNPGKKIANIMVLLGIFTWLRDLGVVGRCDDYEHCSRNNYSFDDLPLWSRERDDEPVEDRR